jgi:hypothetical protein
VKLESLPAPLQATVKEQTKNATFIGLSTEKEKGKTMYEVETKANGKSRDLLLDQTGAVVETEEEVDIDSISAQAKATIQKRAGGGTVFELLGWAVLVEKLTAGSAVSYQAAIKTRRERTSSTPLMPTELRTKKTNRQSM